MKSFKQSLALFLTLLFCLTWLPVNLVQAETTSPQGLLDGKNPEGTGTEHSAKRLRLPLPQSVQQYMAKLAESSPVSGGDEIVRLIVQANNKPIIEGGQVQGILQQQADIQAAIRKLIPGVEFRQSFSELANGFSFDAKRSQIPQLAAIPGVLNVQEAGRFQLAMGTAVNMTQAKAVWEDLHEKGRGMVVAVLDSGVDDRHPDLKLDASPENKLDKAKVEAKIQESGLPGEFKSDKVPYGYNYADGNKDSRTGKEQHGQHVSGIIAANGTVKGVAPEAQILAMKVFPEGNRYASTDDILAGLEDSVKLGADIINMSLGAYSGFETADSAYARALKNVRAKGILLFIAAGNNGLSSSLKGLDTRDLDYIQSTSTVGTPSVFPSAISVASINNTLEYQNFAYINEKNEANRISFDEQPGDLQADGKFHDLVDGGHGTEADLAGKTYTGKLVLLERGEVTFADKAKNVAKTGAYGMIMYDYAQGDGQKILMGGIEGTGIFVATIGREDALKLVERLKKPEAIKMMFSDKPEAVGTATAAQPSAFSSWGPTPELCFKPEIAAPGGQIYSLIGPSGYGVLSGTSMATPHMSGAAALLKPLKMKQGYQGEALLAAIYDSFMNTAKPAVGADGQTLFSPRQQGAGLVQIKAAAENCVRALVKGKPYVELKSFEGAQQIELVLTNDGDRPLSFEIPTLTVYTEAKALTHKTQVDTVAPGASLTPDKTVFELPAKGSATVSLTLQPGQTKQQFVEGYISLKSKTAGQPDLSVPYMGFHGNWDEAPILDNLYIDKERSKLMSIAKDQNNIPPGISAATALFTRDSFLPQPLGHFTEADNPAEMISFSPNGDKLFDNLYPRLGLLRDAYKLEYAIVDQPKDDAKVIRLLGSRDYALKLDIANFHRGNMANVFEDKASGYWNGEIYNAEKGAMEIAPEGQYYYRIAAYVGPDSKPQMTYIPVKLDVTPPTIELLSKVTDEKAKEIRIRASFKDSLTVVPEDYITIIMDGMPMGKDPNTGAPIGYTIQAVDGQPGVYDFVIPNLDLSLQHKIGVQCFDVAFNPAQADFVSGAQGDQGQYYVYPYDPGSKSILPKVVYQRTMMPAKLPVAPQTSDYSLYLQPSEGIDKILVDGVAAMRYDYTKYGMGILWIAKIKLDTETAVRPKIEGYKGEDKVFGPIDPTTFYLDAYKPLLTVNNPNNVEPTTDPSVPNTKIIILPDNSQSVRISGSASDDHDQLIPNNLRLRIGSNVVKVAEDGQWSYDLPLNKDNWNREWRVTADDKAGWATTEKYRFVRESDKDRLAEIFKPTPGSAKKGLAALSLGKELDEGPFMIQTKELKDDTLTLKGKARAVVELSIGGEQVTLEENKDDLDKDKYPQKFQVNLKLTAGDNAFHVSAKAKAKDLVGGQPNDETVKEFVNKKVRILYDKTPPTIKDILFNPALASNDKLYIKAPMDIEVSGKVADDTFGYDFYLDGNHIFGLFDLLQKGDNERSFKEKFHAEKTSVVLMTAVDGFGHKYDVKYPIILDQEPPTITFAKPEPVENENTLQVIVMDAINTPFTAQVADNSDEKGFNAVMEVSMTLNGQVYNGEAITQAGEYLFEVRAEDVAGNIIVKTRHVILKQKESPTIDGPATVVVPLGEEPNWAKIWTAKDSEGKDISASIEVSGTYDINKAGYYTVTLKATDTNGKTYTKTITLRMKARPTIVAPAKKLRVQQGTTLDLRAGVTAYDADHNDLTDRIEAAGTVDTDVPGDYKVVYTVRDQDGLEATLTLTFTVEAAQIIEPVIDQDGPDVVQKPTGTLTFDQSTPFSRNPRIPYLHDTPTKDAPAGAAPSSTEPQPNAKADGHLPKTGENAPALAIVLALAAVLLGLWRRKF